MEPELPTVDMPIEQVMRRWPATIRVFLRHGGACVGCPISQYHTAADSAREYGVSLAGLLDELRAASVAGNDDQSVGIMDDDPPPPADQDT